MLLTNLGKLFRIYHQNFNRRPSDGSASENGSEIRSLIRNFTCELEVHIFKNRIDLVQAVVDELLEGGTRHGVVVEHVLQSHGG